MVRMCENFSITLSIYGLEEGVPMSGPRSPDPMLCDFVSGIKEKVYRTKPGSLPQLKDRILTELDRLKNDHALRRRI